MKPIAIMKMGVGVPAPTYDAAAVAYFAAMSVQPDATRKGLINNLIVGLKADGVFAKLDILYLLAAHDIQAAKLNVINPATFTITETASPTFTTDRGYAGNGTTSYLRPGYNATAGSATQDDAMLGVYVNVDVDGANDSKVEFGAINGTGGCVIDANSAAGQIRGRVNKATTVDHTGVYSTRLGMSVLDRSASTLTTAYRNGVAGGTLATASVAAQSTNLFLGANNNNGTAASFTQQRLASAFFGRSLGATLQAALYSRMLTFLTAIGAN